MPFSIFVLSDGSMIFTADLSPSISAMPVLTCFNLCKQRKMGKGTGPFKVLNRSETILKLPADPPITNAFVIKYQFSELLFFHVNSFFRNNGFEFSGNHILFNVLLYAENHDPPSRKHLHQVANYLVFYRPGIIKQLITDHD